MTTYQINENDILISTTDVGINLYTSSKRIIEEYSVGIDENIKHIEFCESLPTQIDKVPLSQKDEFIDFSQKRIEFCHLSCFFLNFSIDFSISTRELYLATNISEQIFYIKSIYIELYRYLERHNSELGHIKKLYGASDEYKRYNRHLTSFRTKYYEQIKANMNTFFAHLDNNVPYEDYYKFVTNLDAEEVVKMCISFLSVQEELSKMFNQLSFHQMNTAIVFGNCLNPR